MKHSFAKNLLAAVVAVEAALVAPAGADMLMAQTLAEFLDDLVSLGDLTPRQKAAILRISDRPDAGYRTEYFSPSARGTLRGYLMGKVGQGRIDQYTAEIIASTLSLGGLYPSEEEVAATADSAIQGVAPAVYNTTTTEGNMDRLGRSDTEPGRNYNSHYNGIWGYAKDDKEYALQCHGKGLLIIDVTDPTSPVRVQLIPMDGGGVWRDVATNGDYAYVAAQGTNGDGGQPDAYAIDLSYLSGNETKVYTVNENPILSAGINNFGATGYGHTLNVAKGLLFLNTASSRKNKGCRVYDVTTNPMNPRYLFSSGGRGRACHDSSVFENVDGQDLWIVSEGGGQQDRIYDITNVDPEAPSTRFDSIPLLGETPAISGTYAHSNWLSENGRFLFSCEENNSRDIIVHDVTDKRNPVRIAEFQFSEQASFNSPVHNGEIRGEYYFVSYYSGGMRMFDISNPYRPVEVGKVESYRDPNGDGVYEYDGDSGYDGGWNGYPYLPSGNILLSDIYGGTFIVKANPPYDAPVAPNSPTVSKDEGTGDVSLSWSAVDNARGYNVVRSSTVNGPYSVVAEFLVSTNFTDASIGVEDAYYKIKVFNGEGEAESNVLPALVDSTTNGPSTAPTKAPTSPSNPPSRTPTGSPSAGPSKAPSRPSNPPSRAPKGSPSTAPTKAPTPPTNPPSRAPTGSPSVGPSKAPTPPTNPPSRAPTRSPSKAPTMAPRPPCGAKFEPIEPIASCPANGMVDTDTCCSGECFAKGGNINTCK